MSKVFGVDISEHQTGINLASVKAAGVKFCIIRGAYHTRKDKQFDNFYSQCKKLGLGVGVYLYSMATTTAEAKAEANFLIKNVLSGKQFEYPIYYDVEDKVQKALGKSTMDAIIKTFCDTLEDAGYYAGVYCSEDFYNNHCNGSNLSKKYTWWLAKWSSKLVTDFPMWQFGGEVNYQRSNKIAGYTVDQDYCYVDFPSLIKKAGKNGYTSQHYTEVQKRFKFSDETMAWLLTYKYADSLLERLATTK